MGNWLEALRDRVIVRSQVGKRKLDAAWTRRDLDRKLRDLGESVLMAFAEGRIDVPKEIAGLMNEVRELDRRLRSQRDEIAALESEAV